MSLYAERYTSLYCRLPLIERGGVEPPPPSRVPFLCMPRGAVSRGPWTLTRGNSLFYPETLTLRYLSSVVAGRDFPKVGPTTPPSIVRSHLQLPRAGIKHAKP